ncbi:MAG: DMT family transporter [Candidatus Poribacteria bacterium]
MTPIALIFVLLAALLHATWNYLAKKSRDKFSFLWLFIIAAMIIYFAPFVYWLRSHHIPTDGWRYILATGLIHAFYFWFLGAAYERGDLSTVYPIARGTAPVLVPFLAAGWLREFPSLLGAFGIGLVALGIYTINLPDFSWGGIWQAWRAMRHGPVRLSFSTGVMTTLYTVVDKRGVQFVDPFIYIYLMFVLSVLFLTPWMLLRKRKELRNEWLTNKRTIGLVGVMCLGTYLLILSAMATPSKVSYIAAGREGSILFSALFGILLLKELRGRQKIVGAIVIVFGLVCIALAK